MQIDPYTAGMVQPVTPFTASGAAARTSDKAAGLAGANPDENMTANQDANTDADQEANREACAQAAVDAEDTRMRRDSLLTRLKEYLNSYGTPEDKELQEHALEEARKREEDDEEGSSGEAKDAIVYIDPEDPDKVKVIAHTKDDQGKPVITGTYAVDAGSGKNRNDKAESGRDAGQQAESGDEGKNSGDSERVSLFG